MLYDMLIGTFKEGDWFFGCMFWVFALLILGLFYLLVYSGIQEVRWSKAQEFKVSGALLSLEHKASTRRSHAVPVVTGNGVGVGMSTSGESEKHITVWDLGKYGRVVCDDENVFRWAKEKSVLWIKELDGDIRIVGIEGA